MKRTVFLSLGVVLLLGTLLGIGGLAGVFQSKTASAAAACTSGTRLIYQVDVTQTLTTPNIDVHCFHEIRVYASQYAGTDNTILFTVLIKPVLASTAPPAFPELDRFTLGTFDAATVSVSKTYSTPGTSLFLILFRGLGTLNGEHLFIQIYGNNSPAV